MANQRNPTAWFHLAAVHMLANLVSESYFEKFEMEVCQKLLAVRLSTELVKMLCCNQQYMGNLLSHGSLETKTVQFVMWVFRILLQCLLTVQSIVKTMRSCCGPHSLLHRLHHGGHGTSYCIRMGWIPAMAFPTIIRGNRFLLAISGIRYASTGM